MLPWRSWLLLLFYFLWQARSLTAWKHSFKKTPARLWWGFTHRNARVFHSPLWKQLWIGDACLSPLPLCVNFGRRWRGSLCDPLSSCCFHASLLSPEFWTLLWFTLPFNAMGCIQSIRCKPKSFRDSVIVLEVNSSIDPNPTSIDESSSVVLRYRTPHFRASARVLVPPVAGKETWTIGWIQACNHMEFYNTYGNKGMWVPPQKVEAVLNNI